MMLQGTDANMTQNNIYCSLMLQGNHANTTENNIYANFTQ